MKIRIAPMRSGTLVNVDDDPLVVRAAQWLAF
jgi:hypothetical protein